MKTVIITSFLLISTILYSQPIKFVGYAKASASVENREYKWGVWEEVDDFVISIDLANDIVIIQDKEYYIFSKDHDKDGITDVRGDKYDMSIYTVVDEKELLAKMNVHMYEDEPYTEIRVFYGDKAYAYLGVYRGSEK